MYKQVTIDDAVTVTIETRNGGRVRLGLDHPVIDLQRATMDPLKALEIAQALIQAGNTAAVVHMRCSDQTFAGALPSGLVGPSLQEASRNTGAGASVEPPQRAWPVPAGHAQGGRVNWLLLAVLSANAALWAGAISLVGLAAKCKPW